MDSVCYISQIYCSTDDEQRPRPISVIAKKKKGRKKGSLKWSRLVYCLKIAMNRHYKSPYMIWKIYIT